jgi:uncharacterized protein YdcH (DUF465 family)
MPAGETMQVEHHDLHREFPEFSGKIHELKTTDAHFAKLFEKYDALDHEIRRIENAGSLISDAELEAKKLHRVQLKDQLYNLLRNA